MHNRYALATVLVLLVGFVLLRNASNQTLSVEKTTTSSPSTTAQSTSVLSTTQPPTPSSPATTAAATTLVEPVPDFVKRVTKKPFGIYVTPDNSPIQPERFTGYHTGADAEYADVESVVTVVAIADGTVVRSGNVSGYGGMVAVRHIINGKTIFAVYGHLNPANLIANGANVHAGDRLGELGKGYTSETDGERRHLHLGIVTAPTLSVRGYVQTKSELSGWEDPVKLFE